LEREFAGFHHILAAIARRGIYDGIIGSTARRLGWLASGNRSIAVDFW